MLLLPTLGGPMIAALTPHLTSSPRLSTHQRRGLLGSAIILQGAAVAFTLRCQLLVATAVKSDLSSCAEPDITHDSFTHTMTLYKIWNIVNGWSSVCTQFCKKIHLFFFSITVAGS